MGRFPELEFSAVPVEKWGRFEPVRRQPLVAGLEAATARVRFADFGLLHIR